MRPRRHIDCSVCGGRGWIYKPGDGDDPATRAFRGEFVDCSCCAGSGKVEAPIKREDPVRNPDHWSGF